MNPNTTPPMITKWKWAIRNKLLWIWKSAAGIDMRTPAIPPNVKMTINPKNQYIGVANWILPRNIVKSQLKILTPVGIAMIIVMIPKKALTLAPAPMVKKWCNQTIKARNVIAARAQTIDV